MPAGLARLIRSRQRHRREGKGVFIYELDLAHEQLKRMRGMTRYYHERFFSDTRYVATAIVTLFVVGFWAVPEAFLLVPVVALIGANQTAFDASYLYFARHYAAVLETEVNSSMRRQILVGAELEDRYLFPLSKPKVVAVGFGNNFSWFGWITVVYTVLGILAFAAGIGLGWPTLADAGVGWQLFYVTGLGALTVGSIVSGWWWFLSGTGERRLREVLESQFGHRSSKANLRTLSG